MDTTNYLCPDCEVASSGHDCGGASFRKDEGVLPVPTTTPNPSVESLIPEEWKLPEELRSGGADTRKDSDDAADQQCIDTPTPDLRELAVNWLACTPHCEKMPLSMLEELLEQAYHMGQKSRDSDWVAAFIGWGLSDETDADIRIHVAQTPDELGESLTRTKEEGRRQALEEE